MQLLPLSPIRFHILLALVQQPARASMITARVAYDTFGELDLRPATLHDNLRVLLAKGWITEQPGRNFSLTDNGFSLLQNDLYRWRIVTSRANDTLRSRGSSVLG